MYRSLRVRNFRCFEDLQVQSLKRINLITGPNNVGKTALLEAFFVHCGAYNPNLTLVVNALRGLELTRIDLSTPETPWDTIFRNFDTSKTVEIEGEDNVTGSRKLTMRIAREIETTKDGASQRPEFGVKITQPVTAVVEGQTPLSTQIPSTATPSAGTARIVTLEYESGRDHGRVYGIVDANGVRTDPPVLKSPFPALFVAARGRVSFQDDAERYGNLQTAGKESIVLDALRLIEPLLQDVGMVFRGGTPILWGTLNGRPKMPLPLMGGGMGRLAAMTINLGNVRDGVLMVDEIEDGIYYLSLTKMWEALSRAAKDFNVQLFATTHSLECIRAGHEFFSKQKKYDFSLHRLERSKSSAIRIVSYDQETLNAALESGLETR